MKKYLLLFCLPLAFACSIIPAKPNDFPPPPTVIVEDFPTPFVEPKTEPRTAPITREKMQEAGTFQLILLTRATAGDVEGIAAMAKYPLAANIGAPNYINSTEEFIFFYDEIFNDRVIKALSNTDESNLTLTPEGVRIGQGEIWFNLFCVDSACSQTEFFITRINN